MGDMKMSNKERRRLGILSRVKEGEITIRKAAGLLGTSYRQTRRIYKRYCEEGDAGLVHRGRGKSSNRGFSEARKREILELYKDKYNDFGPTLAAEKLELCDHFSTNPETLRQWLLERGLWTKKRKSKDHRRWRERKENVGEMVQMDGSPHDWFEGRREDAVLMVMIDDASSRTHARFSEAETTRGCMEIFWEYADTYGLPHSLYVDRHSIYRCEREPTVQEQLEQTGPLTQFGRAMHKLGVCIKKANSPQAKGRVERVNGTFQDRLIKEMRLERINTIAEANRFLKEVYLARFNEKFNVPPKNAADLHRNIAQEIDLDEVLCFEEQRQVQNDWTVRWNNRCFQLTKRNRSRGLVKQPIKVREKLDGRISMAYKGHRLYFREITGLAIG